MKNAGLTLIVCGLGLLLSACTKPQSKIQDAQAQLYGQFQRTFGASLTKKAQQVQKQWEQADDPQKLLNAYHQLRALRDSIQLHFDFNQAKQQTSYLLDLFWINELVPGLVPELLENSKRYAFFIHYGWCWQQAKRTAGDADEQFFQAQIRLYPQDSVEYLQPRYRIEVNVGRTHSLLGRGFHLAHLRDWDTLLVKYPIYQNEYFLLKNRCVEDILLPKATFWEENTRIQHEMSEILAANLAILNKADNIALQTRLEQLKAPEKYGISVDWQSGRED
jgi:hypothetical protein